MVVWLQAVFSEGSTFCVRIFENSDEASDKSDRLTVVFIRVLRMQSDWRRHAIVAALATSGTLQACAMLGPTGGALFTNVDTLLMRR